VIYEESVLYIVQALDKRAIPTTPDNNATILEYYSLIAVDQVFSTDFDYSQVYAN
jgi:hypothetical protein